MAFHLGRLIDHVHLHARDFAASKGFYEAIFGVLGLKIPFGGEGWFQMDELYVDSDVSGQPSHVHLAFQAADRAMVEAAHAAGLAAGGRDNGAPGERHYHPGYFAGYLLDPDGNNIEIVFHGPNRRSATSIEVEAGA